MAEVAIVRAWLSPLAGDRDVSGLVVPWDSNFRGPSGVTYLDSSSGSGAWPGFRLPHKAFENRGLGPIQRGLVRLRPK